MNNIELKRLRMICALAESGNMTRAAEKLCITQSALSQQFKDIETKLGTDLFFRTRKKMIITEAGRSPRGFPLTWHAVYLNHSNIPIYQQEFIRSISRLNVTEQSIAADRQVIARG